MSADELDHLLRATLFAHIGTLRDAGGGVVTSGQLNAGMPFRGARQPIWNQQKGIFKPQILGRLGAALTIQTSHDSPYDDRAPDATDSRDHFVYRYRGNDVNHADNQALRQAFVQGRPLLYLVALAPGVYRPEFPFYVVGDRPQDLTFELMADAPGSFTSLGVPATTNLPLKAYATRTVRQRLHQARFRYLVLAAYRYQCSMCRLRHTPLLDAAHILPDRDEEGKPEVPNGLSLCKIHHSAYDVGIIGVSADYRVHLRKDVLDEVDGPMLRHGLQELHGSSIQVPRAGSSRPNPAYLKARFAQFLAA